MRSYLTGRMSHANHEDKNVEISSSLRQQPVSLAALPAIGLDFRRLFRCAVDALCVSVRRTGGRTRQGGAAFSFSAFVAQWS